MDNDTIPFVTYIMAAYIIFLVTVYGGNNIVRAYSDMLLGTMSLDQDPVESCSHNTLNIGDTLKE